MRHLKPCAIFIFLLLSMVRGQSPVSSINAESGIRVTAFVEPREVPQNRTALLTIRLEWAGDLDRYEVTRFDNPIVENVEIISTASTNKVSSVNGVQIAQQDYQYALRPEALGMGYVDGIIIRYTDAETKKEYRLYTNRLELKVVDALPEPGSHRWLYFIIIVLGLLIPAVYYFIRRHHQKVLHARLEQERLAAIVPLEEQYLASLKEQINLRDVDLHINDTFAVLSRLLRQYIAAKWNMHGMEQTTSEVVQTLKTGQLDERLTADVQEILSAADIAKFSGSGDRVTLERIYTLFESLLQRNAQSKNEK